jgi:hypothetical protein
MTNQRLRSGDLAGIQYAGLDGITKSCLASIASLLSGPDRVEKAALITLR